MKQMRWLPTLPTWARRLVLPCWLAFLMPIGAMAQVCQPSPANFMAASNVTIEASTPQYMCTSAVAAAFFHSAPEIERIINTVSALPLCHRLIWGEAVYRRLTALWDGASFTPETASWRRTTAANATKTRPWQSRASKAASAKRFGPLMSQPASQHRLRNGHRARPIA